METAELTKILRAVKNTAFKMASAFMRSKKN
jgi:hypothetical protein